MNNNIMEVAKTIDLMNTQLRDELLIKDGNIQEKKFWENTFIKKQIDRRNNNDAFSLIDHIRAMVYSMLSSGISWERVESGIDINTGKIIPIDEIFHQYDPEYILNCSPEQISEEIKNIHCGSQYTLKQMQALINTNIGKLKKLEEQYESIDNYYQKFADEDNSLKFLVKQLSSINSVDKYEQLGEALVAEYLKNVGYDIAKPDRHICRILGSEILGCSGDITVPVYEAFDIVAKLADTLEKSVAEVDYILWSYCAKGYGEICTKTNPKCHKCVAKKICNKN
jgi:3-methyladenine DNA glycosylase Tag